MNLYDQYELRKCVNLTKVDIECIKSQELHSQTSGFTAKGCCTHDTVQIFDSTPHFLVRTHACICLDHRAMQLQLEEICSVNAFQVRSQQHLFPGGRCRPTSQTSELVTLTCRCSISTPTPFLECLSFPTVPKHVKLSHIPHKKQAHSCPQGSSGI